MKTFADDLVGDVEAARAAGHDAALGVRDRVSIGASLCA